jgi:hypothetical protein
MMDKQHNDWTTMDKTEGRKRKKEEGQKIASIENSHTDQTVL